MHLRDVANRADILFREVFWGVDHMGQVVEHLGLDRKSESGLRAML